MLHKHIPAIAISVLAESKTDSSPGGERDRYISAPHMCSGILQLTYRHMQQVRPKSLLLQSADGFDCTHNAAALRLLSVLQPTYMYVHVVTV